jgi:hypothetical protein
MSNPSNEPKWYPKPFAIVPVVLIPTLRKLGAEAWAVYVAISSFAAPNGSVWAPMSELCERAKLDERHVSRARSKLIEAGLVALNGFNDHGVRKYMMIVPPASGGIPLPPEAALPPEAGVVCHQRQGGYATSGRGPLPPEANKQTHTDPGTDPVSDPMPADAGPAGADAPACSSASLLDDEDPFEPEGYHSTGAFTAPEPETAKRVTVGCEPAPASTAPALNPRSGQGGAVSQPDAPPAKPSSRTKGPKARKPKAARAALDDETKVRICASFDSMRRWLLWGRAGLDYPTQQAAAAAGLPPSPNNWKVHETYAQDGTIIDRHLERLTLPQWAAMYWSAVSQWREKDGHTSITVPDFGRIIGALKPLHETLTSDQLEAWVEALYGWWYVIPHLKPGLGLVLDESTPSHSIVRGIVQQLLPMTPEERKGWLQSQLDQLNNRRHRAA